MTAFIAVLFTSTTITAFAQQSIAPPVIYGNDDRRDLFEVINPGHKALSDSTVVLIKSEDLNQNASGVVQITADSLMKRMGVCKTEPYAAQPSAGFCSGFMIGRNLILTAGHCITDQEDCNSTRFVFNYDVSLKGQFPTETKESEVYACKNIIHREQVGSGADFGIIETDRDIVGHASLKLADRSNSKIAPQTKILMIGHPSGLPTKIDAGGSVRDSNPNGYFTATTDSYGGNSGSAVFNLATQEVEGILVRGETDFVYRNGCYVSNVCAENGCRGEDVTKISSVAPFIPKP